MAAERVFFATCFNIVALNAFYLVCVSYFN